MNPKTDPPARLTLKNVAKEIGVSTATISNAFNRPDQLSKELRVRILDECARLGYHGPNPAARSLRTGKTGVVGVMLAERLSYNFKDACAIEFLQGVSEILDEARVNMLLMPGRLDFYENKSLEAIPDRYIVYGPPRDVELINRIEVQRKPMVTVDYSLPNHLALNVDNYGGAKALAEHVLSRTDGQIAVIGLRLTKVEAFVRLDNHELNDYDTSVSRQRLEAYLDAADAVGRSISKELIWSTSESTWDEGVMAARNALMANVRPSALICQSDQLALAALAVAREFQIKVPEELLITGFDDTPEATRTHPEITTVYQPSLEKGRLAARMVLNPENFSSQVLPTLLRIRETT